MGRLQPKCVEQNARSRLFGKAESRRYGFHARDLGGSGTRRTHGRLHNEHRAAAPRKNRRLMETFVIGPWLSGFEGIPMTLPIKLNYPPMEAEPATDLPQGSQWHYDPKWEEGANIALQSKSQKSLSRYFPELVKALANLKAKSFLLDGEIVIPVERNLSFDDLLMRIHPAASRIQKL